jgi:hypothetical protein
MLQYMVKCSFIDARLLTVYIHKYDLPFWFFLAGISFYAHLLSGSGFTMFMASVGFGYGMAGGLFVVSAACKAFSWLVRKLLPLQ